MKTALFFPVVAAVALTFSAACSNAKDATGGKRIALATRVKASRAVDRPFMTGTGWEVELRSASLAIGALYYFDGQPAFAMKSRQRTPRERLRDFLIPTAHAHPQHYVAGTALGEMVTASSVNLLQGSELAAGEGVTGTFRSGRIVLPTAVVGPAAADLAGHIAVASGVATRERTVYFTVSADLTDIQESSPRAEIDGCIFEEVDVAADGTVTLTVTPQTWFNLVDFSSVEAGTEDAPTEISRGNVAHKAFALGVAQLSAYRFAYAP